MTTNHQNETNEQLLRELAESDADELVSLLGLTSDEIIKAFPDHVDAYLVAVQEVGFEAWPDDADDEDWIDVNNMLDSEEEDDDAPF